MKTLLNNNREISNECAPYFIAEVNTSHFGDIESVFGQLFGFRQASRKAYFER